MFSFKSVTINPCLAYDTHDNKDRLLDILDNNPFVRSAVFGVFGDLVNRDTKLEMEPVSIGAQEDKSSVYLQIVIEGDLVHKVGWYGDKQKEIFDGLCEWFSEIDGLELSVLITLVPAPPRCGAVACVSTG